jgi:hypothetical protein
LAILLCLTVPVLGLAATTVAECCKAPAEAVAMAGHGHGGHGSPAEAAEGKPMAGDCGLVACLKLPVVHLPGVAAVLAKPAPEAAPVFAYLGFIVKEIPKSIYRPPRHPSLV